MIDLKTYAAGDLQAIAALALAAVGFVWLIACTNASNLLIARVSSRRRELASSYRTRRFSRAHRQAPARRECPARDWGGCRRTRARVVGHRPAARARHRLRPTLAGNRDRRRHRLDPAGTDADKRSALRPDTRTARYGRSGRRGAACVGAIVHGHSLSPPAAPDPRRVAIRDSDAAPHRGRPAAGESASTRARRSRLRCPQPGHGLDHRSEVDVPRAGRRGRLLGPAADARRSAARRRRCRLQRRPAAKPRRRLQQLRSRGLPCGARTARSR